MYTYELVLKQYTDKDNLIQGNDPELPDIVQNQSTPVHDVQNHVHSSLANIKYIFSFMHLPRIPYFILYSFFILV